jgi:L-seryl-tRNA(Ser) seleniumtransferase
LTGHDIILIGASAGGVEALKDLVPALPADLPAQINIMEGCSQMGSGSLPTQELPTALLTVRPDKISPDELARRLRLFTPPIIARIQDDQVLFDMRTMTPAEGKIVVAALNAILSGLDDAE